MGGDQNENELKISWIEAYSEYCKGRMIFEGVAI